MDYMEMSSVPKSMLEKLLAMTSGSYGAAAPIKNGFRPLAAPLFNPPNVPSPPPSKAITSLGPAGGTASSNLPRRETLLPFSPPFSGLLSEGGAKDPPGAAAGTGPSLKAGNGSLFPVEATVEKVEQKRVRKSRASGTPRKRPKVDQANDGDTAATAEPPATASGPPKRRRVRVKATTDGENAEKPPPKRRNRQSANARKTKEAQIAFSAVSGQAFNAAQHCGHSETSTKGILGVYGLNTKPLDLTRFMKDVSLENLIRGDFEVPSSASREVGLAPKIGADDSFRQHVSSILQVLAKPANAELSQPNLPCISVYQPECKPQKLMLDLESAPQADEEDFPPSLVDSGVECPLLKDLPNVSGAEKQKPLETHSLFPIETLPLFPLTEFWSTIQLHPTESLESFLSQATASGEGRSVSSHVGAKMGIMALSQSEKTDSLPPFPFSINSAQPIHENGCDRYSRANYWFRAGTLESSETCLSNLVNASQESRPPFKAESENDSGRLGQKESLMDIDLNKQSPEAEAADTVKHSGVVADERLQVPPSEQSERDVEKPEPPSTRGQQVQAVSITEQIDSICSDASKVTEGCNETLTEKVVTDEIVEELDPTPACENSGRGMQREPSKEFPKHALSGVAENDVPCSPRVQAAAHLLCKMAISSSPFFVDSNEGRTAAFSTCNDVSSQRISKAARVGPSKTIERVPRHLPENETHEDEPPFKNQVGEGRKKLLSQVVNGYSPAFEKSNAFVRSRERSSTPSRNVSKITKTRLPANTQSSESDRSPDHGAMERSRISSNDVQVIKMENCQPSAGTSSKIPNSSTRESRGSHTVVSKVNTLYPTQTRGTTGPVQLKSTAFSGTELPIYAEVQATTGHPRSSSACFPPQRNVVSSYPVKPRNSSSWQVKSVRPLAGEVRQGTKRLDTK